MGRPRKEIPIPLDDDLTIPYRPPAQNPELREMQLINMAMATAEQQMLHGTASPSVICHLLKLGSQREQTELEKLRIEKELALAKIEALKQAGNIEELYKQAMSAMTDYRGSIDAVKSEDEDEDIDCYDE